MLLHLYKRLCLPERSSGENRCGKGSEKLHNETWLLFRKGKKGLAFLVEFLSRETIPSLLLDYQKTKNFCISYSFFGLGI